MDAWRTRSSKDEGAVLWKVLLATLINHLADEVRIYVAIDLAIFLATIDATTKKVIILRLGSVLPPAVDLVWLKKL